MFLNRPRLPLVAIALAMTLAEPVSIGASAYGQADRRSRPGDFDFYILALSIAPSFCDLTGYRRHKMQCANPSDAEYQETPLTIHGLWPNKRNRSPRGQPQSCSQERLPQLSDEVLRELQRYMPGITDGLAEYEWMKHGVCTGLTPDAYVRLLLALAKAANETIGQTLRERGFFGRPVPVSDLVDAVAAKNPELADALIVDCQFARPRRRGEPPVAYIAEIRVLIAKDIGDSRTDGRPIAFVPRSAVGYGANSGCPRGVGFLPASFEE